MWSRKSVLAFGGKLLLIYALLIVPWPGVQRGYNAFVHAVGNTFLGEFGARGRVHFQPIGPGFPMQDTQIQMRNVARGSEQRIAYNIRYTGYVPTVLLVSLIVSTPLPWRRRRRTLLWGLLFVQLFVLLRIALLIAFEFRMGTPVGMYHFSPFWHTTMVILVEAISASPVTSCIVPVVIWVLVAFRREDLAQWFGTGKASSATVSKPVKPQAPSTHRRKRQRVTADV